MLIHLEGNIASGKTTLGEILAADRVFAFVPEPVDAWQERFTDNVLERFYADMTRWSFSFQICTFMTRAQVLSDVQRSVPYVVAERSIGTDLHVFAPTLHAQGAIDELEWDLYRQFYDQFSAQVPQPDRVLYLRTPPEECLRRLQARSRHEEVGVTLDYLQNLGDKHDRWLLDRPDVIVLDGMQQWTAAQIAQKLGQVQLS